VDAIMCYKQKCKVVSLNLAHPVRLRISFCSRMHHWPFSHNT